MATNFPMEFYVANLSSFIVSMIIIVFTVHYFEKNVDRIFEKVYDPIANRLIQRHRFTEARRKKKKNKKYLSVKKGLFE